MSSEHSGKLPTPPTHGSMARGLLRWLSIVMIASGFLAPLIHMAIGGIPPLTVWTAVLVAVLVIIDLLSDRFEVEFHFRGESVSVTPASVVTTVAVLALPPAIVPLVLVHGVLLALPRPSRGQLMNTGVFMFGSYLTAVVVHALVADPAGAWVLPLAILAALLFDVLTLAVIVPHVEAEERGAGLDYLRESLLVTPFNVVLPAVGAAVVGPFLDRPLLLAVVLVVFQGVAFLGLRTIHSEQMHRQRGDFLRATFSRYVPSSVVDQLEEGGAEVALGGEQAEITVMFVDVRNFTSWSETLPPSEVLEQLNELMTELTAGIFSTDGTLDKFTGDGLMAFWGAPVHQPDHADRALAAAREMIARVQELDALREARGQRPLRIGIGIHSGVALVGNVGHESRLDYTAIGDTVNLAARLEAATKQAGCTALVSAQTLDSVVEPAEIGPMERLGPLSVKGRREPVEAFILNVVEPDGANAMASGEDSFDPGLDLDVDLAS